MSILQDCGESLIPDTASIDTFLTGVVPGTYEFRLIDPRMGFYGRTQAMYARFPEDQSRVVQSLGRITGRHAPAVYIVGNPVNDALLGRGRGAFFRAKATATDVDVLHRRLFYLDVDSERPSGINANRKEIDAAMIRTAEVVDWLHTEAGFGVPWFHGCSGSGGMLLYRVDLPNDAESAQLFEGCLKALADAFPADGVKIDTGVFNAARLFRVPGTVNGKSNTPQPDRPWSLVTGTFRDGDQ